MNQRQKEYQKKWVERNRDKARKYALDYYYRKGYLTNKEKMRERKEYMKQYRKDHPEVELKSKLKRLTKLGSIFNMSGYELKHALMSWSKSVRKRDNNECQICHKTANKSHHIFYQKHYPQLALNINNGITLCDMHHYEVHGQRIDMRGAN